MCNKSKISVSLALQEYLQLAKKYYNAEPQSVDFVEAADEVRREINSRIEQETEGKIQPPISEFKRKHFGIEQSVCIEEAQGR